MGRDDPAAVVHADLFDELAQEFFGLFGSLGRKDGFDLVSEVGKLGRVGRRVPVWGELPVEVGLVGVECFEALAEATDALLAAGLSAQLGGYPAPIRCRRTSLTASASIPGHRTHELSDRGCAQP
jgi:hypothetical protein